MIILDTYMEYAQGPVGFLSLLSLIIGIVPIIFACVSLSEDLKDLFGYIMLMIGIFLVTIGIIGICINKQDCYKVYLEDMSLKEFEENYEVGDIDGLIITAYKKGE